MAMTLAEKIIARAAGREQVTPGDSVTCAVDLAMIHDSGGPRRAKPILDRLGVGLWDASKVVLIPDHYVPDVDDETRRLAEITRDFVAEHKLASTTARASAVVLPGAGISSPACSWSAATPLAAGGAFGAYMWIDATGWQACWRPAGSGCACPTR